MSVNLLGYCSSIVHATIAHPKLAAIVGIAGVIALSGYNTQPTSAGIERTLKVAEEQLMSKPTASARADAATAEFDKLIKKKGEVRLTHDQLRVFLDKFDCNDCRIEEIEKNKGFMDEAVRLYYMDIYNKYGGAATTVFETVGR
jgi:hypothetical protein